MFKWLKDKMSSGKKQSSVNVTNNDGVAIGYALSFVNTELGVDYFGSPFEILQSMKDEGQDPKSLAEHISTEIDARMVSKEHPELKFHGGKHAESVKDLLSALSENDYDLAKDILKRDPEVVTGNHDGAAIPLLPYCISGQTEVVRFRLGNGASPDRETEFKMSPLHWAAAFGHKEVVQLLRDAGGDVNKLSWFNFTPADLAELNGHTHLSNQLSSHLSSDENLASISVVLERMGL